MIMFRADADQLIATGHLMRTLTIAEECTNRNVPVCLVLSAGESEGILKALCPEWKNYQIRILPGNYRRPEEELPEFQSLLEQEKPQALLIDSYYVTEAYLKGLQEYVRIFYLDDIRAFDYPVDTVINYDNISKEELPSYQSSYSCSKTQLLGVAYTPLRKQFCGVSYQVREKVANVLITTGGTDESNITREILESALKATNDNVNIHVVIGRLYRNKDWLSKRAEQDKRVHLHEGVLQMADLLQKCDLALSAAGTTLYELCAIGVPTICFAIAENQLTCAKGFAAAGAVIYEEGLDFQASFNDKIKALADDYPLRCRMSAVMRQLVDGRGVGRIVDELLEGTRI